MQEQRPDPDALLEAIKKTEARKGEGKLRIFLGMSAGVGKTYAMLSSAHQKMNEGVDIVIGTIDTHGRPETEKLLTGLPSLAKKTLHYRGVDLQEMDIDEVLDRKPKIVLVDELAHTNIPGSRHPKRWQDVVEILANGIDVWSTLNVQHIESRKDDVEVITGVSIRETVPDSVIERADSIEVIDIPPTDLLRRLEEGNVYLGDKAQEAAQNFFKAEKLTALREILLRLSADKVDGELSSLVTSQGLQGQQVWKTRERILVAVGHGPLSDRLVRTSKQIATRLKCPWIALYVETGEELALDDRKIVERNLDLARELGAQVVTTADIDLVSGIDRICRQYHVSQIVIGKPGRHRVRDFLRGGHIVERLNNLDNNVAIHIVRQNIRSRSIFNRRLRVIIKKWSKEWHTYLLATIYAIVVGLSNAIIYHYLGLLPYRSVGLMFLLGVSVAGMIFRIGPTMWISFLSMQIWNVFFIPPLFTFHIDNPDDIFLCISFFFVASITGYLTSNTRRNQSLLRRQEEVTSTLYNMSSHIVEGENRQNVLDSLSGDLSEFLKGQCAIALRDTSGVLDFFRKGEDWIFNRPKEWAVAQWAFENEQAAGKWTDTLPSAEALYVPLNARGEVVGILAFRPKNNRDLGISERELIFTISSQLALYLQRELYQERAYEGERLRASEKLHQALLNSVSHEIKTPLTAIQGIAENISSTDGKHFINDDLKFGLLDATRRLKRVIDNILDMSRLDNGMLELKLEWADVHDLFENVRDSLQEYLLQYEFKFDIQENFPFVKIDARLFEQVLMNLLLNAIQHTPQGKVIEVSSIFDNASWSIFVDDEGIGVPKEQRDKIFTKFYRIASSRSGGSGLGLSIVKSVVELHGGSVRVLDGKYGGARFVINLPITEQVPPVPEDMG